MKLALYKLILLFLLLIPGRVFAQTAGNINIKVSDAGSPVAYATVYLAGIDKAGTTNIDGVAGLNNISFGKYELTVSMVGYVKIKKNIVFSKDAQVFNITLEPINNKLNEVVISANLTEQRKDDSPIAVDIISAKAFGKNPSPSLFEAVGQINGVMPQINCGVCSTGDIHINGMEGPYTMITIDGMPIVGGLSTIYGLSGIPSSIINRIEVVKGPASTLYGSEAVGGLVNVITQNAFAVPRFSSDIMHTSIGETNTDLSVKLDAGKNTSALLGVNVFNFNNRIDLNADNFTDITLQKRVSVFNKWNFLNTKTSKTSSMAFRYVYEDRFGGELQWTEAFRGGDSIYGESIYTNRAEVIGNYFLPTKQNLNFQYSLSYHNQNSAYGTTIFDAKQVIAFGQLLYNKKINARNSLIAGIPVRYTFYDDNTTLTREVSLTDSSNTPQKVLLPGIFAQNEYSINERLLLLAGLRYDYNSIHGSIVTPRVAIKYNSLKNHIFRLSIGNGYRIVNLFTEDHAAVSGSREVVIKSNLKPEKSWNANFNYTKGFFIRKSYANADAGLFYTYFLNKIVGDFISDPNKIIYDNLNGYGVSRGAYVNFDLSMPVGLKINIGGTYNEVYTTDSADIKITQLHAPKFMGTYSLSYTIPRILVNIDITGKTTSPMKLPVFLNDYRPEYSPWFNIFNIKLGRTISKRWEIYAGVKNLFNFLPQSPLMRSFDPFDKNVNIDNPNGYTFDTAYNYSPLMGRRYFIGVKFNIQ